MLDGVVFFCGCGIRILVFLVVTCFVFFGFYFEGDVVDCYDLDLAIEEYWGGSVRVGLLLCFVYVHDVDGVDGCDRFIWCVDYLFLVDGWCGEFCLYY